MKYLITLITLSNILFAQEFYEIKSRTAAYRMFNILYTGKFKGAYVKDYKEAQVKCHNTKEKAIMYIVKKPKESFFCAEKHGIKYFFDLTFREVKPVLNNAGWLPDGV